LEKQNKIHGMAGMMVPRLTPEANNPWVWGAFDWSRAMATKMMVNTAKEMRPNFNPCRRLPLLRNREPRSSPIHKLSRMWSDDWECL
jgi:hypothetical protein